MKLSTKQQEAIREVNYQVRMNGADHLYPYQQQLIWRAVSECMPKDCKNPKATADALHKQLSAL